MFEITDSIYYIGVDDHEIDLFESQYIVPGGMAYNSYVIMDEHIAVIDTVERNFSDTWLGNVAAVLGGRSPEFLIVQHMEPDHSGSIAAFLSRYPDTTVVATASAVKILTQFHRELSPKADHVIKAANMSKLSLGSHTLTFVHTPMVHWPEVMMSFEESEHVLFSADAFGKFGALDYEDPEGWACEARRYYFGIVGRYGAQVQAALKKLSAFDIRIICSLHGPVLRDDLSYYLSLYDTWSSYRPEDKGVFIAYTSVYGGTKDAALSLAYELSQGGMEHVSVSDLSRDDWAEAVEDAFRYDKLVIATTTYNNDIFPSEKFFIDALTERNFQSRKVAIIENGSWAPQAAKKVKELMSTLKDITWLDTVTILSTMSEENKDQIISLAQTLLRD